MRSHFNFFAYTLPLIFIAGFGLAGSSYGQSSVRVNFQDQQLIQEAAPEKAINHSFSHSHSSSCDSGCDGQSVLVGSQNQGVGGGCGGCADGGSAAARDGMAPWRSRLFLEEPIPRGAAAGVHRVTRGTQCNSGCNGCEDCRGGVFSGVGQGAMQSRLQGGTGRWGGRPGVFQMNGGYSNHGGLGGWGAGTGMGFNGGAGLGSRVGSRINAGGMGGENGYGWGSGMREDYSSGGAGFGGGRAGWAGRDAGDGPGLGSRLGGRVRSGAGGYDDGSYGDYGAYGAGGAGGMYGGWGAGAGMGGANGYAGHPGMFGQGHPGLGGHLGGCANGCGQVCNCLSNAHAAMKGLTGPSRGQVPHTAEPNYGMGGMGGQASTYAYPYYTTRGPRDFLIDNPPSIGW